MGVTVDFLSRVLESKGRRIDLRDYRDGVKVSPNRKRARSRPLKIGIDVSCWIYRAGHAMGHLLMKDDRHLTAYGRASLHMSLPEESNNAATAVEDEAAIKISNYCRACANYVLKRLELLKEGSNADLLVVFDGRTPPIKRGTVAKRIRERSEHQAIRDDRRPGAATVPEDIEHRTRANRRAGPGEHVPRIVDAIMDELRQRSNSKSGSNSYLAAWMVAPYEADSQLAYLSKQSYIDLVITEDTDLIAHGCRSVLYKCLDPTHDTWTTKNSFKATGTTNTNKRSNENQQQYEKQDLAIDITRGILLEFHDLGGTKDLFGNNSNSNNASKSLDFTDFTPIMMAVLFVLLGCDYNGGQKLKGIGLTKACRIVRKAFLEGPFYKPPTAPSQQQQHQQQRKLQTTTPTTTTTHPSDSRSSVSGHVIEGLTPSPQKRSKHGNSSALVVSCLDVVWKEAYEHSYTKDFSEEFKREYQQSFVAALWMYRHPVVFDPMIRSCLKTPAPVSWEEEDAILEGVEEHNGGQGGDPELVLGCEEYHQLLSDPTKVVHQIVGELPPTQEDCIAIAEGRLHKEWRLKKPTPVVVVLDSSNNNSPATKTTTTTPRQPPSQTKKSTPQRKRKKTARPKTPASDASSNNKSTTPQTTRTGAKRKRDTATTPKPSAADSGGTRRSKRIAGSPATTTPPSTTPAPKKQKATTTTQSTSNPESSGRRRSQHIGSDTNPAAASSSAPSSSGTQRVAAAAAGSPKEVDPPSRRSTRIRNRSGHKNAAAAAAEDVVTTANPVAASNPLSTVKSSAVVKRSRRGRSQNRNAAPTASSSSTGKSNRRRSLDGDEIAAIAAGGIRKEDPKHTEIGADDAALSRKLWGDDNNNDDETQSKNLLASSTTTTGTRSKATTTQTMTTTTTMITTTPSVNLLALSSLSAATPSQPTQSQSPFSEQQLQTPSVAAAAEEEETQQQAAFQSPELFLTQQEDDVVDFLTPPPNDKE